MGVETLQHEQQLEQDTKQESAGKEATIGICGPITLPKVKELQKKLTEKRETTILPKDIPHLSTLEKEILLATLHEQTKRSEKRKEAKTDSLEKQVEASDEENQERENGEDEEVINISYGFTNADFFTHTDYNENSLAYFNPSLADPFQQGTGQYSFARNSNSPEAIEAYQSNKQQTQERSDKGLMSNAEARESVQQMVYESAAGGSRDLNKMSMQKREQFKNMMLDPQKRTLVYLYEKTAPIQAAFVMDYNQVL